MDNKNNLIDLSAVKKEMEQQQQQPIPWAFPFEILQHNKLDGTSTVISVPGMTLLDYFASQIIGGMDLSLCTGPEAYQRAAIVAYATAAEMMKERQKYHPASQIG